MQHIIAGSINHGIEKWDSDIDIALYSLPANLTRIQTRYDKMIIHIIFSCVEFGQVGIDELFYDDSI